MELKDKLPQMSEDEMLRLLATDGMLVKRPLLVGDDFVLVGFKESEWAARVKNEWWPLIGFRFILYGCLEELIPSIETYIRI